MDQVTDVVDQHRVDRHGRDNGEEGIFDEDLVEEISIDGMCGVY